MTRRIIILMLTFVFIPIFAPNSKADVSALSFSATAHAFKLIDGCIGLNVKLRTRGSNGEAWEWRALVLSTADELRKQFRSVDYFDVDLRRGDLTSDRDYREADGLAHYVTHQWASQKCGSNHSQLQSARRLMTKRDFEIYDLYLKMVYDGTDEDRTAQIIEKRYKLPKGWRLPKADMTIDRDPTPFGAYKADATSLQSAFERAQAAIAKIR